MKRPKSPYKSSIWRRDPRYTIDRLRLSATDFATIARLGDVDVAKKQVPPIPGRSLLEIAIAIKKMPSARNATAEDINQYLRSTIDHHGAGIATLMCMLAVDTGGDYAPIDRKFVAGLKARRVITAPEQKQLNGKSLLLFSAVYVQKVLPAWRSSCRNRTPQEADNYWGRGGVDAA